VFQINTDGTGFATLYTFTGGDDGANPVAGLLLSGNTLYGVADGGGSMNQGTAFKVNTDGTGFAALHSFTGGSDGASPAASLILSGNTLHGTTPYGLFQVNTDGTSFIAGHSFTDDSDGTNSDGANPEGSLVLSSGTLYGTASAGGSGGNGTVFKVSTNFTSFATLHNFSPPRSGPGQPSTNSDGANPFAGLVLSGNTLYGTTPYGGSSGAGTVFQINTDGTGFATLYTFTGGSDGANPRAQLILSSNTLYGTASEGGSAGAPATVFMLNLTPTGPGAPTQPGTSGLMAYYPLSGNANDASGNGNNGISYGPTATTDRFGTPNGADAFNGTSDYIWIGNGVRPSNITACAWFNTAETNVAGPVYAGVQHILRDSLYGWALVVTGAGNTWQQPVGTLVGSLWRSDGLVSLYSGDRPYNDGAWHFVALTYDGLNASLFIDGVETASQQFATNMGVFYEPDGGGGLAIGRDGDGGEDYFGGKLQEIRIYNRGLSVSEVQQLYAPEATPQIITQPQSRTAAAGSSLQFSVTAGSPSPMSYQWRKDGVTILGFTDSILTRVGVFTNDVGAYSVVVSNAAGTTTSADATLTVRAQTIPPILAGPITNQANGHLYFFLGTGSWVEAEAAALSIGGHLATVRSQAENDWIYATFGNFQGTSSSVLIGLYDTDPLDNSTNRVVRQGEFAWISGEPVTYANWWTNEPDNAGDLGEFYGMIWGGFGSADCGYWNDISDDQGILNGLAEITLSPSLVMTQPTNRTSVPTSSVSFAAQVSGLAPLAYLWLKDGQLLPNATNQVCTIVGVEASDAGAYGLVVSNAFGSVTGQVATLTVLPFSRPAVLTGAVTNPANDHLYYLLDESFWVEAEAAAVALGGHLATIRSQAEQDWVYSTFGTYGGVARNLWIGLYDADPVHYSAIMIRGERMPEFVWISGEPVSYANWHPIEPNNGGEESNLGEFHVHMLNPAAEDSGYAEA
jgi:uncharacterized repeat protein (TIGR03803 family)